MESQVCRTAEGGVELVVPGQWREPFLLPTDGADPDRGHLGMLFIEGGVPFWGGACVSAGSHPRLRSGFAQVTSPCPTSDIFLSIAYRMSEFYSPLTRLIWE